ncbi:hypothetical protein [Aeromicrobium endophyticum]|uniref:hypothetical protein n=1 Tax=Aeromicrobium endophyticum TaxID=2292704 RepID=UPI0018F4B264|nr:hypothetical protein [Aeromicrobium endophyticum]
MAKRVCIQSGCGKLIDAGRSRCPDHERQRDKARGTRQARGYGAAHDQLRAAWQTKIDHGDRVVCWRPDCDTVLVGRNWHLGHDDHDRTKYRGPECVPCNLAAAGRQGRG